MLDKFWKWLRREEESVDSILEEFWEKVERLEAHAEAKASEVEAEEAAVRAAAQRMAAATLAKARASAVAEKIRELLGIQ